MTRRTTRDRGSAPRRDRRRASPRASRQSASCSRTCCVQQRPDVPVLFLDTFHHFAETLEYRDEMTRKWNLNLITLRAAQPRPGLWEAESTDACCRATRWSRCLPRSRATTCGSPRCAAISRRRARTCRKSNRSGCRAERSSSASARWPRGPRRMSGRTRDSTTSRCCRSTIWATRASAASPARHFRSTPPTRGRAGGGARSWSAAFISRPSRTGVSIQADYRPLLDPTLRD